MAARPLILFHYPLSPFSEKIRAMLGYAGIPWSSVTVAELPPRPVLERLAGGYRRVPVALIGADVFCDTRTIATEIAARAGRPELALEACSAAARKLARRADGELLLACTVSANTLAMGRRVLGSMSLPGLARFAWDRFQIGRKASLDSAAVLRHPRTLVREQLDELERRLRRRDFVAGAQPCHADFSCYHGLWFLRELAQSSLLQGHGAVNAWMDRIQAFGHGRQQPVEVADALAIAGAARPRRVDAASRAGAGVGAAVQIAPADYAQTASSGRLVGAGGERWVIARDDAELGRLHVHFPTSGYRLQPISS